MLGNARCDVQIDIGFGDAVTPEPTEVNFPLLLPDNPPPIIKAYPKETVIAEKLQAIVSLGMANSRMKDYYDVWAMSQQFDFDGQVLRDAVRATFRRRKTELPAETPIGLSPAFASAPLKQTQWRAFVSRTRLKQKSLDMKAVVDAIRDFIMPPTSAALADKPFPRTWSKGGPWK